jgi:WD40 repeat protein
MLPSKNIIWLWTLVLCSVGVAYCSFAKVATEEVPDKAIDWHSDGRNGWRLWGRGGDCFFGMSADRYKTDVWQWTGETVRCHHMENLGKGSPLSLAVLNNSYCICYSCVFYDEGRRSTPFMRVFDFSADKLLREWQTEEEMYYRVSRTSDNGKHLAFWAGPETSSPDYGTNKVRLGMLASKADRIDWVTTMQCGTTTVNIGGVVPSNDGKYVALSGWDHGAALVDVPNKRVLWQRRPQHEVCFTDIAFSPDSELVYAGGAEGCVYGMKVQDGEIVSRWWASPNGKSEYGYRISTISVSPDGKFVAAGTGPTGDVYVFSTKDGSRRILNHGGSTILITSFSPDSKRLASFAAGQIKIWKLPEEKAESKAK